MADYRVETPLGLATLTLDKAELDIELSPARTGGPAIHGDRAFVRSTVTGQSDLWAVYERAASSRGWTEVTSPLTADQITDWPAHRVLGGSKSRAFDEWLGSEASRG